MELIINGLFILVAQYLGYLMGRGKELEINFKKFKAILRTEEEEEKIINDLKRKKLNG